MTASIQPVSQAAAKGAALSRPILSPRAMTVFATLAAVTFSAGSSAPTPLYHLYQEQMALSPATVTTIFAAYAFSLLAALLTAGSLSDHLGRRPVIAAALALNAVALLLFLTAGSAAQLIAARVVQGFGVGLATATLGAAILDTSRRHGPVINSVTIFVGLSAGALGAGLLIVFAPAPTHLVYAVLLAVTAVQMAVLAFMPETTERRPGALASLRPTIVVPKQARAALLRVSPVTIAAWALGGFYLSLMPSLVRTATGLTSPLVGAVVVAALMLTAAASVLQSRAWSAARALSAGACALGVGVAIVLAGVHLQQAGVLLAGTIVAGVGSGMAFSGSMRTVLPLAEPSERAGLLSAYYIESYLAFSLPAIAAGLAAPRLGLEVTAYVYGALVAGLAVVSLIATRMARAR